MPHSRSLYPYWRGTFSRSRGIGSGSLASHETGNNKVYLVLCACHGPTSRSSKKYSILNMAQSVVNIYTVLVSPPNLLLRCHDVCPDARSCPLSDRILLRCQSDIFCLRFGICVILSPSPGPFHLLIFLHLLLLSLSYLFPSVLPLTVYVAVLGESSCSFITAMSFEDNITLLPLWIHLSV